MVFIAGEAGIGKTALLRTFLENITAASDARVVCGHCVEQFGTREAYLPIFDALSRLCSDERAGEALIVLAQYAPSWLAQMPGLLSGDQFQTLQKMMQGTTQARVLGEFCEALEALAADQLLVLGLEDLHWTDLATLDLLSIVARREHRARLMVIGTYRPADVIVSNESCSQRSAGAPPMHRLVARESDRRRRAHVPQLSLPGSRVPAQTEAADPPQHGRQPNVRYCDC